MLGKLVMMNLFPSIMIMNSVKDDYGILLWRIWYDTSDVSLFKGDIGMHMEIHIESM
jgi:hypothetical protein